MPRSPKPALSSVIEERVLRLQSAFIAAVSGLVFIALAPAASAESMAQALAYANADHPEVN